MLPCHFDNRRPQATLIRVATLPNCHSTILACRLSNLKTAMALGLTVPDKLLACFPGTRRTIDWVKPPYRRSSTRSASSAGPMASTWPSSIGGRSVERAKTMAAELVRQASDVILAFGRSARALLGRSRGDGRFNVDFGVEHLRAAF